VVNPPNQVELSAEELAEIQEDEKVKKCEEEKAKWQLWKTIVGNCVIDRTELDDRFETFLLCLHCLREQMVSAKDIKDIELESAMLQVQTKTHGFACTVYVKCKGRLHDFHIEPPCVPAPMQPCITTETININESTEEQLPGASTQLSNLHTTEPELLTDLLMESVQDTTPVSCDDFQEHVGMNVASPIPPSCTSWHQQNRGESYEIFEGRYRVL